MSAPCFGWAIEQGRARKLSASERWVLAVLANRANGSRICWPSLETIAADTGLSARTVFSAVHSLAAKGLIEIRKFGRSLQYLIRRPADPPKPPDEPPQPLQASGEFSTGSTAYSQPLQRSAKRSQPLQASRRNEVADTCKIDIATLANGDSCKSPQTRRNPPKTEPSAHPQSTKKENLERKRAIAHDLEGKEAKQTAPDREPLAKPDREPTVAEVEAKRAGFAADMAALARSAPGVASVLANLGRHMGRKAYAIGERPVRDVAEQIAACTPVRPKARFLEGAQLAAFRALARAPVGAGT